MTCAIRENAETKVWNKVKELSKLKITGKLKQMGILGCIAERLKTDILSKHKSIDIIAGPDSYRDLPKLLSINRLTADNAVNVLLSMDETYSDVMPTLTKSAVTAFVSIMRGCDNVWIITTHSLFNCLYLNLTSDVFLLYRSLHERQREVPTYRYNCQRS